jgi:hypothetical protein
MKKTILATAAVLAMSGTAMAGSLVDINQLGVDNVASSVQLTGNGNEAHIRQAGDQNSSITKQDGSGNYLRVRQSTNHNAVGDDSANTELSQTGKNNEAYVDQMGGNFNKVKKAVQIGDENSLKVKQDGTANLVADTRQDGKRNAIVIKQNGYENEVRKAVQDGNDNTLNVAQASYKNLVTKAESHGNGNAINIKQTGTWNGQGNNLNGTISGMPVTEANFSLHGATRQASAVVQNGNSNTAKINENGFGQSFEIYQGFGGNTSTGSTVVLTQNDAVNYAYAQQTGSDHTANITQDGHLNRVFVKQAN